MYLYYTLIEICLSNIFILNIIAKKYFRYFKSLAIYGIMFHCCFKSGSSIYKMKYIYLLVCLKIIKFGINWYYNTFIVKLSIHALRIRATVAGASSLKWPWIFISLRAALIASLIAKNADDAKNNGGSPTACKHYTINNLLSFVIISFS